MIITDETARHCIKMVLTDNKGQLLTEAMCIGLEESIMYYLKALVKSEQSMVQGAENGLD